MHRIFLNCVLCSVSVIILSGCITVEHDPLSSVAGGEVVSPQVKGVTPKVRPKQEYYGIYHKVLKGETLWRIAKTYGVDVDLITVANQIPNAAMIEENQLIMIPGVDEVQKVAPVVTAQQKSDEFIWPLQGRVISYFQDRLGKEYNRGIHIEARSGSTVRAVREGTVVFADRLAGYAQTVILDHGDGFFSVYGRNAELSVDLGDYVFQGDSVGRLGDLARRNYLHFEIRQDHRASNPLYYLPRTK